METRRGDGARRHHRRSGVLRCGLTSTICPRERIATRKTLGGRCGRHRAGAAIELSRVAGRALPEGTTESRAPRRCGPVRWQSERIGACRRRPDCRRRLCAAGHDAGTERHRPNGQGVVRRHRRLLGTADPHSPRSSTSSGRASSSISRVLTAAPRVHGQGGGRARRGATRAQAEHCCRGRRDGAECNDQVSDAVAHRGVGHGRTFRRDGVVQASSSRPTRRSARPCAPGGPAARVPAGHLRCPDRGRGLRTSAGGTRSAHPRSP